MAQIVPEQIGSRLLQWRKGNNLTQQVLSDELEVSRSYVKNIETGQSEPSFNFFKKFLSRYGTNNAMLLLDVSTKDAENKPPSFTIFSKVETLPRKGIASCSNWGWAKAQIELTALPQLEGLNDPDAFYVAAHGQSMMPEGIDSSNICLISPAKKIKVGDRVWIKDKDGKTTIKRLMAMNAKWVSVLGWLPIADGKQTSFDAEHAISYIDEMHPVVAVYRGKPGNDNVEFKPDPKAEAILEPAIAVTADRHSHSIIRLHDIQAAAGTGSYVQDEKVISSLAFPNPWLSRIGINPNDASLIYAKGTSMAPTIQDGAMLLIDHRKRDIKKKQIYVFREGDELYVKRLEMLTPETMIVSSDNPDFETRLLQGFDLDNVEVIGEIVWQGAKV